MYPLSQPARRALAGCVGLIITTVGGGLALAQPSPTEARAWVLDPSDYGNPEGIAFDQGTGTFFVGTLGDGTIYRARLDDTVAQVFIPGTAGGQTTGLEVRQGRLYAAGGWTGQLRVYDIESAQQVATFDTGTGGLLNDLAITPRGDVYITDSFRPVLWHLTAEQIEAGVGVPEAIDVSADIPYVDGDFNLNGIVSLQGGTRLVVGHTARGELYRIDLPPSASGARTIHRIDVEPLASDGLLIDNGQLVVVTFWPQPALTFVTLDAQADAGVVTRTLTHPLITDPSTVARARNLYLVVNVDFASTGPFTVAGVPRTREAGAHEP